MTVNLLLELISSFGLGFLSCIKILDYQARKKNEQQKKEIEDIFISVKNNIKKVKFKQRVQNYVHLKSGNYTVVYILDKKELAIFEKDICIAISSQITESKVPKEIMEIIENKFHKDIHLNILQLGNYIISQNVLGLEMKFIDETGEIIDDKTISFDLDTILDKINKSGINSLTKEEQEYLNNLSK
jgi:hypothetical protein